MEIKDVLFKLSNACAIGTIDDAANKAEKLLSEYAPVTRLGGNGMFCTLKGEKNYTILLDAHIDEVGFVVTDITDEGFLTVQKCGGIDLRHLPAKMVTVHGKEEVPAVFVSTPPHLDKGDEMPDSIAKYKLDTGLGASAKDKLSVGDYVTYRTKAKELLGDAVCGKSFDDRAGVACLIELARRLSNKTLPCNVVILLSDAEELGLRGAKTAAYSISADEAIAIDVSFGNGPDVPPDQCGKIGEGAMIGVSPTITRAISNKLISIAKKYDIKYQTEVMGGNTSTNADVISITKCGIPTGLISIPLRNMHTDVEMLKICDIESVCDILEKYVLSGGVTLD